MTNKLPWFRYYSETTYDEKFDYVAEITQLPKMLIIGTWDTLLSLANRSPVRGELRLTEKIWHSTVTLQKVTQLDTVTLTKIIDALFEIEVLSHAKENGHLIIANWGKRQFASDSSAERVRKHREKKRLETLQKQNSNAPDTDTDIDTDIKDSPPPAEKPKRKRKPRDERLDHPAVIAYKKNARLNVPVIMRDDVIDTITDANKWAGIIKEWIGYGFKPTNIKGMLDVYKKGWNFKKDTTPTHRTQTPEEIAETRRYLND
jgi:hypothetical protein